MDSDIQIIACLQAKLGLGMIQVIRLAIRRLAEIENVLNAPPRKKGYELSIGIGAITQRELFRFILGIYLCQAPRA